MFIWRIHSSWSHNGQALFFKDMYFIIISIFIILIVAALILLSDVLNYVNLLNLVINKLTGYKTV